MHREPTLRRMAAHRYWRVVLAVYPGLALWIPAEAQVDRDVVQRRAALDWLYTSRVVEAVTPSALYAGVGNVFGWIGVNGEYFPLRKVGAALGLGVTPLDPRPLSAAAALRIYGSWSRNRPFLQLSFSPVLIEQVCLLAAVSSGDCSVTQYTGPGIALGYSYVAPSGFTLTVGAGLARGKLEQWSRPDIWTTGPIVQLGVGFTRERHRP